MNERWSILVTDDEPVQRESMAVWLKQDGFDVDTAASGREAIEAARAKDYALYFLDLKMPPGIDGIETMAEILRLRPAAAVIIITAYATVDTAIAAMKEGAVEYIVKPCNPQEISLLVQRIIRLKTLERENLVLREKLEGTHRFHGILSKSPRMKQICSLIADVADLPSTVLIRGESGTGKEVVARAVHAAGRRAKEPFVAVSCAALTETLLESELFGHERGSFTGADALRKGKLELAGAGTLFLDEIGDISPKLQVDLLRVLQEHSYFRVGGTKELKLKARVIAATNVDLELAIREGRFREDLFYRLDVITVRIPPLRERREDVPLLARHFLESLSAELGKRVDDVSEDALRLLVSYDWPGNVRELENVLERAMVSCRGHFLTAEDFTFLQQRPAAPGDWSFPFNAGLRETEQRLIEVTLERCADNVTQAAGVLGIDRSTLYDKISRYGIERPQAHGVPSD